MTTYAVFEDEDGESEELDNQPSSEEEEDHKRKFPKFFKLILSWVKYVLLWIL